MNESEGVEVKGIFEELYLTALGGIMIMVRAGGLGDLFPFLVSSRSLRKGYSIRS